MRPTGLIFISISLLEIAFDKGQGKGEHAAFDGDEAAGPFADEVLHFLQAVVIDDDEEGEIPRGEVIDEGRQSDRRALAF